MSFLQPILLFGLPLIIIPLLIHLMNRLRYRSLKWGAMDFLLKASKSSRNMARIKQLLVLLCRIAAILALLIALARPLIGSWLPLAFFYSPETIVLLFDRSATMGLKTENGELKVDKALRLISEIGSKSAPDARIVLIDSAGFDIRQVPAWNALRKMKNVSATATAADFPLLFKLALDYCAENSTGLTEIWAVSDLQRSNWAPESPAWADFCDKFLSRDNAPKIKVLALNKAIEGDFALSFSSAVKLPSVSTGGLDCIFDIKSAAAVINEIPVTMIYNDSHRQFNVSVRGGESRFIRRIKAENGDICNAGCMLPADRNDYNNSCFFSVSESTCKGQVVLVSELPVVRKIMSALLETFAGLDGERLVYCDPADFSTLKLSAAALIIWQGAYPEPGLRQKIDQFAEHGGMVLFFPPAQMPGKLKDDDRQFWSDIRTFTDKDCLQVKSWRRQEGVLADSGSGTPLPLDRIVVMKMREPMLNNPYDDLAVFSDSSQFLVKVNAGAGAIYSCASLPLNDWSSLADGSILGPLVYRLFQKGARQFSNIQYLQCARLPELGNSNRCHSLLSVDNTKVASEPGMMPGIFSDGEKILVVNRPESEDILEMMTSDALRSVFKKIDIRIFGEGEGEAFAGVPSEIWKFLLVAMLFFMLLEAELCRRMS